MSVFCDAYEMHETIMEGEEKARNFTNVPTCEVDIDYTTLLEKDCFKVNMTMSSTIKDGDTVILSCRVPFSLEYSLAKYDTYGEMKLLTSAFHEIEEDGYRHIKMTIDVFLFSRVQAKGRGLT